MSQLVLVSKSPPSRIVIPGWETTHMFLSLSISLLTTFSTSVYCHVDTHCFRGTSSRLVIVLVKYHLLYRGPQKHESSLLFATLRSTWFAELTTTRRSLSSQGCVCTQYASQLLTNVFTVKVLTSLHFASKLQCSIPETVSIRKMY